MPATTIHDRITVAGAVLCTPLSLGLPSDNRWFSWGVFTGSLLLSGLLFSNDLDIQAREYRRWGPLRWIWWPYERLLPHRSWLSHGLVVGPLLRLIYFALWVNLLLVVGAAVVEGAGGPGFEGLREWHSLWIDWMRFHPRRFVEMLAGFTVGGALHSVPDWLQTAARRAI